MYFSPGITRSRLWRFGAAAIGAIWMALTPIDLVPAVHVPPAHAHHDEAACPAPTLTCPLPSGGAVRPVVPPGGQIDHAPGDLAYGIPAGVYTALRTAGELPDGNTECGLPRCFDPSIPIATILEAWRIAFLDPHAWDVVQRVQFFKCGLDPCSGPAFIAHCEAGGGASIGNYPAVCLYGLQLEAFVHELAHVWEYQMFACVGCGGWTVDGEGKQSFPALEAALQDFLRHPANARAYPAFYRFLQAMWAHVAAHPDQKRELFASIASWTVSCGLGGSPAEVPPAILRFYEGFLAAARGLNAQGCARYDFDGSHCVNDADLAQMADHVGTHCGGPNWDERFDLNGDCRVDASDRTGLERQLGTFCPVHPDP